MSKNAFTPDGGPHRVDRVLDVSNGLKRQGEFEAAEMLVAYAALLRERESAKAGVTDAVVAGALFDFLGYLTARDEAVTFSCSHGAGVAVKVLEEWASKRSLFLNEADVKGWREAVAPMLASARVPDAMCGTNAPSWVQKLSDPATYAAGWNACREAMLAKATGEQP